jgi:hypothetical protein
MSDTYGGPLDATNAPDEWDRSPSGFPDEDPPHPFPDGNSASGWGTSNSSTFHGVHTYPGGDVQHVAKVPGGAGFTGDDQPESD